MRGNIVVGFCLGFLAVAGLGGVSGCTSKASDGLEEPVEDPNPDDDQDSPKFCNPAGKQGKDLETCYSHNEDLYKEFDEEAKKREPWFNFTPDSWVESPEVDQKLVLPVTKEKEAVSKLEGAPIAELTPTEVEFYTGRNEAHDGLKAFLVRGLLYYRDTGSFSVFEKDQSILVRHDSIGKEITDETRSAVVVFLPYTPKTVYVDCGVAD